MQGEPMGRVERETAAVAVIIRSAPTGEEVLLIRRAVREGDPWSGDAAFPGGRVEAQDGSFRDAAVREALEEVGVDLAATARFLGCMHQFQAKRMGIWVVPVVFLLTGPVAIRANSEVSSYFWVPFPELLAPENRSIFRLARGDEVMTFPSLELRGYVVWGLTERILSSLAGLADGGTG
jgi:8-oxo-dGTP pyrophosphatase MutT (NUDIX family)